jgi:hypothetical protein
MQVCEVAVVSVCVRGVHEEQVEEFEALRTGVQVHGRSIVGWAFKL